MCLSAASEAAHGLYHDGKLARKDLCLMQQTGQKRTPGFPGDWSQREWCQQSKTESGVLVVVDCVLLYTFTFSLNHVYLICFYCEIVSLIVG